MNMGGIRANLRGALAKKYLGNVIIPTDSFFSEGLKPPRRKMLDDFGHGKSGKSPLLLGKITFFLNQLDVHG